MEYALLRETGHELGDIGRTFSWRAFESFLKYRESETGIWETTLKTNAILADIYDALAQINANLVAIGTRNRAKAPKPYPRPGMKTENAGVRHFGKGALPPDELHKWFEERQKQWQIQNLHKHT